MSPEFYDNMTQWLIARQTLILDDDQQEAEMETSEQAAQAFPAKYHVFGATPERLEPASPLDLPSIEPRSDDLQWVGVNGRCNKAADTCYTFWVGGTLAVSLPACYSTMSSIVINVPLDPE